MPYAVSKKGVAGRVSDELAATLKARGIPVFNTLDEAKATLQQANTPAPERKGFAVAKDGRIGKVSGTALEQAEAKGVPVYDSLEQAKAATVVPKSEPKVQGVANPERIAAQSEQLTSEEADAVARARYDEYTKENPTISAWFPYGAQAQAKGEWPFMPAIKDVLSYPGRAVSAMVDGGGVGKTSEQYAAEGSPWLAGISDPSTGGMMLAAPLAEGLAAPKIAAKLTGYLPEFLTKTVASAAPQVGANFATKQALESSYAAGDLIGDLAASITGPTFAAMARLPKTQALKSLRKEIGGNVPDKVLEEVYDRVYRSHTLQPKAVGRDMLETGAKDLEGGLLPPPRNVNPEAVSYGDVAKLFIDESVTKGPRAGGRTLSQAENASRQVANFEKKVDELRDLVSKGKMSTAVYKEQVAQELKTVAHIPEAMGVIRGELTLAGETLGDVLRSTDIGSWVTDPGVAKAQQVFEANTIELPMARMTAGDAVQQGLYSQDIPLPTSIQSAAKGAGKLISLPRAMAIGEGVLGAAGTMAGSYLPYRDREYLPPPR